MLDVRTPRLPEYTPITEYFSTVPDDEAAKQSTGAVL